MDSSEAAIRTGDYRLATTSLEAALREAESFGTFDPNYARTVRELALVYRAQGRYTEAELLFRRELDILEKVLSPNHPRLARSLNNLAVLHQAQGRYVEAESLIRRSLAIYEQSPGANRGWVVESLNNLAALYQVQGRYADAEQLYRRALPIAERFLGRDQISIARVLNGLGSIYKEQGRYAETESLFRRSLAIYEKILGSDHHAVGTSLNNLGLIYQAQGRYAEAEPLFRRALVIGEKALGQDHTDVGLALSNLAVVYLAQGRYAEAEPLFRRALAIVEKALSSDHPTVALSLNNLAGLYTVQGRFADAAPLHRRALSIYEKVFGRDHPSVALSLNNLALLYGRQGKLTEALGLVRRSSEVTAKRGAFNSNKSRLGPASEQKAKSFYYEVHVALLAAAMERGSLARAEATQEGFGIAQLARASDTAEQVAKMAARHAAGSDALSQLARARQDTMARFEQVDSRIIQAAGQPDTQALAAKLRDEQAETLKAIVELDARLESEYPQYRELTNPQPLKLAAAQNLLAPDEALVLLLVSRDESYLWVLRNGEAGFFRLALKRSELAEIVKKLRSQLDLNGPDPQAMLRQPFNVTLAHELFRKVLAPAGEMLKGVKHLIFIPDGAMQSLPLGVLVAELPAKPITKLADHAQVAWLAKQYAITVLPAAASLRALRQFAKAPTSQEPFSGYGDPVLKGDGQDARNGNVTALYSRGAVADVNEVRKLGRLPDSADELRAIAKALKASATSVKLGPAATERAVKAAHLTRFRNLAFATHGLMAGDFKGLAEPALVLTPPEKGSDVDDGLLTAGEISQLKLDAEWVILSACNTAAPDGTPGAEGLSGLARAFFYAGARSLLVSHWAVASDATAALTARMFDATSKGTPKAEALRRSMLALMEQTDKPHFAHPAFWAPFVVVGEGNTKWAGGR